MGFPKDFKDVLKSSIKSQRSNDIQNNLNQLKKKTNQETKKKFKENNETKYSNKNISNNYVIEQNKITKDCVICNYIDKLKKNQKLIYEDKDFVCFHAPNPSSLGHLVLTTKEHLISITKLNDNKKLKLGSLTLKISKKVNQLLKPQGLNVFIMNGFVAGQNLNHFLIHILPRNVNDNINLSWQPKQISQDDFIMIFKLLIQNNNENNELREQSKDLNNKEIKEDNDNKIKVLLKHYLDRIP